MLRIELLFNSKTLRYYFCKLHTKIVTFLIEKMKLVSFNLFLDAFPPRPKMPFGQWYALYTYTTYVKGVLGLGGKGVI